MKMNNANKKKAVVFGALALVILMVLFYFLTIFQNLKVELNSAKSERSNKESELQSLQNEAAQAKVRESEYGSLKSLMGEKVTVFYGEDEGKDRILYEMGQLLTEAQINVYSLTIGNSDFKFTELDYAKVQALIQGETVETVEETQPKPSEEDTVHGEKMVTLNTEETQTETLPSLEVDGTRTNVNLTFRTGYKEFKNFVSMIESQKKHINISSASYLPIFSIPAKGSELIDYEIDEAGIPNDYQKILDELAKTDKEKSQSNDSNEQILVFEFTMTLTYSKPAFVEKYRELEPFDIPEDLLHEPKKGEVEDEEDYNPLAPPEWFVEQNDDALESIKASNK